MRGPPTARFTAATTVARSAVGTRTSTKTVTATLLALLLLTMLAPVLLLARAIGLALALTAGGTRVFMTLAPAVRVAFELGDQRIVVAEIGVRILLRRPLANGHWPSFRAFLLR